MRLWAWNIHATSPWKPCIEVEGLVFLSLSLIPHYFTLKNWHYLKKKKKKVGQEGTGHENLSFLLQAIASSRCGKRNSCKSLWPVSCPCPVHQEEAAQWYSLLLTCSFNILYVFRLKSIFNLLWSDVCCKKLQSYALVLFSPFSLKFSWKFQLFANCCAR